MPVRIELPIDPSQEAAYAQAEGAAQTARGTAPIEGFIRARSRLPAMVLATPEENDPSIDKDVLAMEFRERLLLRLWRRYDVDLSGHKSALLLTQVAARMARLQLKNAREYLSLIEASARELQALFSGLLVGSTNFFRDPAALDALCQACASRQSASTEQGPLRAWVAGCSTGEEAYSLAILLLEWQSRLGLQRPLRIFATDVRHDALTCAREGIYPASIAGQVSQERLERFFVRVDGGFRVRRILRDAVLFARHDLLRDAPYARLELVSCRNLLLYFRQRARRLAFERFRFALRPDALLLLGSCESALEGEDMFAILDARARLYTRREHPSPAWLSPNACSVEARGPPRERDMQARAPACERAEMGGNEPSSAADVRPNMRARRWNSSI